MTQRWEKILRGSAVRWVLLGGLIGLLTGLPGARADQVQEFGRFGLTGGVIESANYSCRDLLQVNVVNGTYQRSATYKTSNMFDPLEAMLCASEDSLLYTLWSGFEVDVEQGDAPSSRTLLVSNYGTGDMHFVGGGPEITGFELTGPGAANYQIVPVNPPMQAMLTPGQTVAIRVIFNPTASTRTMGIAAALRITTDAMSIPDMEIQLLGDAVPVTLSQFSIE